MNSNSNKVSSIIKLTTPWDLDYYAQTPMRSGIIGQYRFEINNNCDECDYWIVWGGLLKDEKVNVTTGCTIYITDEAHDQRQYNQDFLDQFEYVASVRRDLDVKKLLQINEIAPWYFQKDYESITTLDPPKKTKLISVISSDLTWLPGHKKRFAFVNKLIGHFKDRLDVYGRGFNPIPDKYDALVDYKYSIAIENNVIPHYFTEKLSECFLTYTMPIYYGCPNVLEYYNEDSMVIIDIDDYKEAISCIEKILDNDLHTKKLPFIRESRKSFLTKYHVFPSIIRIIYGLKDGHINSRKLVKVIPEEFFNAHQKSSIIKRRDKQSVFNRITSILR